jgi:[protein-PII] uridylyltransferase
VDCFAVRDAANDRAITEHQFESVHRVLESVLVEGRDIQHFVEQSRRRIFALLQPRVPLRTRIEFDNEASATDTVIDVETGDRTGLLYDIARAMSQMGMDIFTARIMTDARRVRDAFYVRLNDAKILDSETQSAIRAGLQEAIHPAAAVDSKGDCT